MRAERNGLPFRSAHHHVPLLICENGIKTDLRVERPPSRAVVDISPSDLPSHRGIIRLIASLPVFKLALVRGVILILPVPLLMRT
jgi:hypothetical protein